MHQISQFYFVHAGLVALGHNKSWMEEYTPLHGSETSCLFLEIVTDFIGKFHLQL